MAYTPGTVSVEEISTSAQTVVVSNAASSAAFIGGVDRGPTIVDGNGFVVGVPQLVTSLSDFKQYFSYSASVSDADFWSNATDLKYAINSFFKNGGGQAYIVRDIVATDAAKASSTLRDQNASITQGSVNWTFATATGSSQLTVTSASGTPFNNVVTGSAVDFANITATGFTFLNDGDWVVKATTSTVLTVAYSGANVTTATQASGITVTGSANSSTTSLIVTAKDHGAWGNKMWVGVYPNVSDATAFDLVVYLSTSATDYTGLKIDASGNAAVETWPGLSMDSTKDTYFTKVIKSKYVDVTLGNTAGTGRFALPVFTGTWSSAVPSVNITAAGSGDGKLSYNIGGFTKTAIQLGTAATSYASAVTAGANGTQNTDLNNKLTRLDGIDGPLVFNVPNATTKTDVDKILAYAATRKDAFAVIDCANDTVTNVLTTVNSYATTNAKYGAVYYPQISVGDDKTKNSNKTIPAGGAVTAAYVSTDTNRGVFKSPAGVKTVIADAVSVPSISVSDYSLLNNNPVSINVIRRIPSAGFCIMGARTLSTNLSDRYITVRRSLIYLSKKMADLTAPYVFEVNNQKLWNSINDTLTSFLYKFWFDGGLAGSSADQAFYIKCDSTNNTGTSINLGQLNIEVGVALTRPAEYIVIKIGQTNAGSTISTVG